MMRPFFFSLSYGERVGMRGRFTKLPPLLTLTFSERERNEVDPFSTYRPCRTSTCEKGPRRSLA
jgi:hypothetical protein